MKYMMQILFFVVALTGITGSAQASTCLWSFDGKKLVGATVPAVKAGTKHEVAVTVNQQGQLKLPEGWVSDGFVAGACLGPDFNAETCGTWAAHKELTNAETATFAVENAGCSPSTQVVSVSVETPAATGVSWTQEEKDTALSGSTAGTGDIGAGLLWAPNLPTTTRPAWGFNIVVGIRTSRHLKLGAAVRAQWTGIPIDPALRPQVVGTTESSHFELFRILGVITPSEVFHVELGGEAGAGTFSYSQTFIRQNANLRTSWVAEDTDTVPVIGPTVAFAFYPADHFRIDVGASLLLTTMQVRRNVGSGPGGSGGSDPDAGKKIQAIPQGLVNVAYVF